MRTTTAASTSLRVSVIVVTAGRRQCLPACIDSLQRQTYRPLEIVIVVGPSTDGTIDYVRSLDDVKHCQVDKLNISHARNQGLREASGEIIAFIDDDAVAHPFWVQDLIATFEQEGLDCGGVGGCVINEHAPGRPLQAFNNTIDDLGWPDEITLASGQHNDPQGTRFNYLMGTNMAFRRSVLIEIGGFDETYIYVYDDADTAVEVIKRGYRLLHHRRAIVYHFPAMSHNRKGPYDVNHFVNVYSQIYFSMKHSGRSNWASLLGVTRSVARRLRDFASLVAHGHIGLPKASIFTVQVFRGLVAGYLKGRAYRKNGRAASLAMTSVKPFRSLLRSEYDGRETKISPRRSRRLHIALVCGEFGGPEHGGVCAYTEHLARALTLLGHRVVVLRAAHGPSRISASEYQIVDVPVTDLGSPSTHGQGESAHGVWSAAAYRARFAAALDEISRLHPVDIVEAPLWSGEGVAVGAAAQWPLVVRLETPSQVIASLCDIDCNLNIAAERLQLAYAAGVIGISQAVVRTIEEVYNCNLASPGCQLTVIPLGLPAAASLRRQEIAAVDRGGPRFLYVGRLETRKGTLELAEAFALTAQRLPNATLWLAGKDNSIHDGFLARTGKNYVETLTEIWDAETAKRVSLFGPVSDAEKNELYARCDVLVSPARYESFGMTFVEAMRQGKPVIGTKVGGIPEVVEDGVSGILVAPDSPQELAGAMTALGANADLRARMGQAGIRRFESRFDLYRFGLATEQFYRQVLEAWHHQARSAPPRIPASSRTSTECHRAA